MLGNWLGRGLVGPIDEEGIHDGVPLGIKEGSSVVGRNMAEGRSDGIALDGGDIREGRRLGPIKGAPDVDVPDNDVGGGPRVGPWHRRQWYALALCIPYSCATSLSPAPTVALCNSTSLSRVKLHGDCAKSTH